MNNELAYGQKMNQYLDEVFTNAYSKVPEDDPDALRKALYHIGMELTYGPESGQTEDPSQTRNPIYGYRFVQAYLSGGEFHG